FHNDKGHITYECMKLKKQIEELVRAGKLSHLIKEIKQGRDQSKTGKKETAVKDKPTTIYMVQSWQRTVKQKATQSFERVKEIAFPPLAASNETEGPLVIEAEMGGHMIHHVYIDGGSSIEILYEHCFNRLRPEIKSQMVLATTSLTGFSAIRGTLSDKGRTELCSILKKNLDIFAWQPSDMTGVPQSVAEHRLNIREGYSPVRQKKRGQALERAKAIQAEVQKLVEAGIMREVYYHDWLSNPVMLAEADKEKTAFHTGHGVYYYTKMPFGLKIAGATYQRLMDRAFEGQIGWNIEVYVDDLVVKSFTEAEMMRDIEETFHTLRKVNIKLNPKKCSFGLAEGVFLGNGPNANLLYKPRVTGSGTKLLSDGETGLVTSLRGKQTSTVFSGTSYHDGSSCVDGSGAGLILTSPEGVEFTYALRFQFTASNNEAEYEALVAGLRIAARMGVKNVQVSVDSKLVANQVLGTYVAKEDNMVKYMEIVKSLVSGFTTFSISQVPRSKNKKTDALRKIASTSFAHLSKHVLVEVLENKSIKEKEIATVIEEDGPTCMTQLVDYLKEGVLPGDKKEARKLRLKAAEYVMREIHEGSCSMHAGPRSIVAKSIRLGYYWPTMHKDARDMIRKCSDCPFPEGPGKVKFLIVAMDYFTKWIEAKAVATITGGQFSDNPFKDWCDKLNITQRFASVKHPQSNRLVERANRSLGEGIKSRLGEGNKNWVEELPHVFWDHRTMIKSNHGDTPFSLTYGTETVIPTEIGMPTYRTAAVDVVNNDEELRLNLDLLEERRERATICEAKAKSKMTKYYNARVRGIAFKPVILFTAAMTLVTQ
nr:reverse transcriptase domain-containing protein [Tanacetum cinerariifolium]